MEHLIAKLEAEIAQLIDKLRVAHEEITQLKQDKKNTLGSSASMDLLQNMTSHSTEYHLQLYAEDSIDLLPPAETEKSAI